MKPAKITNLQKVGLTIIYLTGALIVFLQLRSITGIF